MGVRSVRKRGPTASQVGSGPRESRVLELGKLVCRPPGRRRRCPTQDAPRTPRVHLPSPRAPPSAMPRKVHVPPRRRCDVVEIRRAQEQAEKDAGRQTEPLNTPGGRHREKLQKMKEKQYGGVRTQGKI